MLKIGEIIDNNFVLDSCGEGAYAQVYKIQDLTTLSLFALKICKGANPEDIDRFKDENQILHTLRPHKNIITPISQIVEVNPACIYYIMELADFSLDGLLISRDPTDKEKIDIFFEICEGLKHAHSKNVIHRDLHWGNILIVGGNGIKINDFGKAREFIINRKANSVSPCWGWFVSPPEFKFNILEQSQQITDFIPGDIYALGIILYYLFESSPFDYITELENSIKIFLVRNNIKLSELDHNQRSNLYKEWLSIFTPTKKLIVSAIKDDEANININEIIRKATILDVNLRYQKVDELIADVKNITI